jgi:hypothetical protein
MTTVISQGQRPLPDGEFVLIELRCFSWIAFNVGHD